MALNHPPTANNAAVDSNGHPLTAGLDAAGNVVTQEMTVGAIAGQGYPKTQLVGTPAFPSTAQKPTSSGICKVYPTVTSHVAPTTHNGILLLRADTANTGSIWLTPAGVTLPTIDGGIQLLPGEAYQFDFGDPYGLSAVASLANQQLNWSVVS